jgi:AhpD family alkylhydroperoxidase
MFLLQPILTASSLEPSGPDDPSYYGPTSVVAITKALEKKGVMTLSTKGQGAKCETMENAKAILDELREPTRSLRAASPGPWAGFGSLHDAAMADGALSRRAKELIALAIAVTRECDGCIVAHAKGAARHGATPEEVAETLSVALLMNGGPATVYGPRAWAAYQEFAPVGAAKG